MLKPDLLWPFPFVDAPVAEDPACSEVAPFPVDDEALQLDADVAREAAANACVLASLPDEGNALGDEILALEVAELRDPAALDRPLAEGLDVSDVVQGEGSSEQVACRLTAGSALIRARTSK